MSFQFVPKSVTLNDLEPRFWPLPSDNDLNDQGPNWLLSSLSMRINILCKTCVYVIIVLTHTSHRNQCLTFLIQLYIYYAFIAVP